MTKRRAANTNLCTVRTIARPIKLQYLKKTKVTSPRKGYKFPATAKMIKRQRSQRSAQVNRSPSKREKSTTLASLRSKPLKKMTSTTQGKRIISRLSRLT